MMKLCRVSLVFALMLLVSVVYAQDDGDNLLENPSFELPYLDQGGNPIRQVAQGWTAWHTERQPDQPSWRNRQPEYQPATAEDGFINSGEYAQVIFNNTWWTHEAGIYQEVQVSADSEVTFSVYAHVWSSKFEDKTVSQDGGGVSIQVGIDPTGGTDATSDSIVWSDAVEQYDAFVEHSQTAVAENDTITVWVKSFVADPVQNSFVYVDDASLIVGSKEEAIIDEEPVDAEATETVDETAVVEPTEEAIIDEEPVDAEATETVVEPTEEAITDEEPVDAEATETVDETTVVEPTEEVIIDEEPVDAEATETVDETAVVDPTEEAIIDEEPVDAEVTETVDETAVIEPTEEAIIDEEVIEQPIDELEEETVVVEPTEEIVIEPTIEPTVEPTPTFIPTSTPIPATEVPSATPTPSFTNTPLPPTATPTPLTLTEEEEALTNQVVHVVSRGETVGRIAAQYGSTVNAVSFANNLNPDNLIFIGQELIIPISADAELATEEPVPTETLVPPTDIPPTAVPVEPTETPEIATDPEDETVAEEVYYVRYGDTLAKIAWRYNTTVLELAQRNAIVNINRIYVGQALFIPVEITEEPAEPTATPEPIVTPEPEEVEVRYYTVQYGDSLYRISGVFNVSIDAIAEANHITNYHLIYRGQVLIIP